MVLGVLLVNRWLALRREASRQWGRGEAGRCWYLELLTVLAQVLLEAPACAEGEGGDHDPGPH